MIRGLDSATPPTPAEVATARAAGVAMWSGYIESHPMVNLLSPWSEETFATARECGAVPIAFCSGLDDPKALASLASEWQVRLCLDVEGGIRGDGAWVQGWLDASGAGLYGNAGVHNGRRAAFHILAAYPAVQPQATWDDALAARPAGLCGWQSRGTHSEFGVGVDSGYYDDGFMGGMPMTGAEQAALGTAMVRLGMWRLGRPGMSIADQQGWIADVEQLIQAGNWDGILAWFEDNQSGEAQAWNAKLEAAAAGFAGLQAQVNMLANKLGVDEATLATVKAEADAMEPPDRRGQPS